MGESLIIRRGASGGSSGGTLVVTAPVGVTVTATKDGKTYTRVVNAEGNATFRGLSSGTWMLSIDDATHEPSTPVPVEINADYTVSLSFFSATINITYPATSTCVVTDSGGATVASDSNTGGDAKTFTATVTATGTYTVTATATDELGNTISSNVSITTDGQSESVTLSYWDGTLYYNGDTYSYITGGYSAVPKGAAPISFNTDSDGQMVLEAEYGNNNSCAALTNNSIDLTEFNTLSFTGYYTGGSGVSTSTAGLSNTRSSELTSQVSLPSNNAGTVSLDISGLSGPYYIGVWAGVYKSTVTISKIWLS